MYSLPTSSVFYTFLPSPIFTTSNSNSATEHKIKSCSDRSPSNRAVRSLSAHGLRTPPSDDMGTIYQQPHMASYDTLRPVAAVPGYPTALSDADRKRTALSDAQAALNYSRVPVAQYSASQQPHASQQKQQEQQRPQHYQQIHQTGSQVHLPPQSCHIIPSTKSHSSQPSSRQTTRQPTPVTSTPMKPSQSDSGTSQTSEMVRHSLDIPRCISPNGGNLAHFAAQMTCLFWFESIKVHQAAEDIDQVPPHQRVPRLTSNAIPSDAFKKWVYTILSTTQVTQNVVLLALRFIYRLKMTNPQVKGRPGSEFRLLTVALMLGNKFLDDNTYTNKTWADVSGIPVGEIHVMEVEFLSNMRYSLLVSKNEWEAWLVSLANFWEYCERSMRPISPLALSPSHHAFSSPMPSPTYSHGPLSVAQLPISSMYATNGPIQPTNPPSHGWPTTYQQALSPLAHKPDLRNAYGKRELLDEDVTEPPAKRVVRQTPQSLPSIHTQPVPQAHIPSNLPGADARRLPAPQLTLNLPQSHPAQMPTPMATPGTYIQQPSYGTPAPASTHVMRSLPPLVPGQRAMATVFSQHPATTMAPQLPMLATTGPGIASMASSGAVTPTGYVTAPIGYGTPTKRLSPVSAAAFASSPLSEHFAHVSGVHTPLAHSPSVYLQQRNSPYKPVRHVHTLLRPPPSASLQEYHLSGNPVPPTNMHYQPIGRRNEFRTGIVPEFQDFPYGGAVRQGLALTPLTGMPLPTARPSGQAQRDAFN